MQLRCKFNVSGLAGKSRSWSFSTDGHSVAVNTPERKSVVTPTDESEHDFEISASEDEDEVLI